jgi:hypothetical protein
MSAVDMTKVGYDNDLFIVLISWRDWSILKYDMGYYLKPLLLAVSCLSYLICWSL